MNLRHLLGTVVLLVIVGAAATVTGPTPPPSNVLNFVARSPVTTSSISFSQEDAAEVDHEDLLPPQTTTTLAAPTTTTAPEPTGNPVPESSQSTTTQPAATTTIAEGGFNAGFEAAFFSKVNAVRASQGLPTLARNSSLDSEARAWAKSMAASGVLGHSDIGRLIPPWSGVAENVGNGPSVSSIFSALSSSSGHLQNMLGDYTNCGIGVWVDADGILWTVHLFTR